MDKTFTKHLFLLAIFTLFTLTGVFAQTITVGTVDPGPYGQGSSIAVPINVNTTGGCITAGNTYNVYLSDASGNFSPGTLIGSSTGVYTTFVNAIIPNGTAAGAGYKVEVKSTNPAVTSTTSAAFSISANPGVTASLTSTETVSPGVYGRCVGTTSPYNFTSTAGGTVTASFFNETTQASEGSNVSVPAGGYSFTPALGNYTVTGKSVNASGTVGTFDYQLINNVVVNPFSPYGTPFVCIPSGGTGNLQFIIPITGAGSIINNYPGTTYTVNWGDGTSTTFSYCEIVALGGILTHTYTLPSCGQTSTGGATNSLTVVSHATSPYCGEVASAATTSAKVIITPTTSFNAPAVACVGTALTIPNTSSPGPDYSTAASSTCATNPGALYDWTLDGVAVAGYQGVLKSKSFVFPTTTTPGIHTLTLHSEFPPGGIGCLATDYTQQICFENPPQPVFSVPTEICISSGPVTPTNTSTIDATCGVDTYQWIVTGPGTVTYAGGTNSASKFPQFVFPVAGVYSVQLGINSGGCGLVKAAVQKIIVDETPTASMSPNATICGNNLSFTFDPSQTITKTVLNGTVQIQPNTYTWTITGGNYSFINGTTASSQYPQILFADFGTYTISVHHTNGCGAADATQVITFVQAPDVDAGADQNICASSPATTLAGTISGSYTNFQWVGGNGTFSPNRNTLNAVYTPTNAEITAGSVNLTLQATTALPAPCNQVTDDMTINITPTAFITSPPTASVCSGEALSYNITTSSTLATLQWTAALTSGTATGYTASGTDASITDVLTNTGTTDAVVTYTIIPTIGSCPGTPFTLTVSVHPLPVITAAPVLSPICNNQPANIVLTSNVGSTSYTWTSTAPAGITGNTNQATALVTNSIQDVLINSGTTPATVTYVVTPYNGTCPGSPVTTSITVEPAAITADAGPAQELCNTTSATLHANNASPQTGLWTQTSGPAAGVTFSATNDPNATVSGLAPGNVYQFQWTITALASCPPSSSTVSITIDSPPVGGTATANPAEVCSGGGTQITLSGQTGSIVQWESSTDGTTWTIISNTTATLTIPSLLQATQYRALIHNGTTCADVYSTVASVTVNQPPTTAIAGPSDEVCNATVYTLQGNAPTIGTGKWTQIAGPAGTVFVNDANPTTAVNNLTPGTYQFQWTITASASCPASSSIVTITIDSPPVGGTATATPAEVCLGSNSVITLAGQLGSVVQWESSTDGFNWTLINNTTTSLTTPALSQTTQYRAKLHNTSTCPDVYSTIAVVTVDQPPSTAIAGPADEICNTTIYTLQGNTPTVGTGKWTQIGGPIGITFTNDANPHTTVTGLLAGNTYQFQWTITAAASCPASTSTVMIKVDDPPVGGTATATPAEVCLGSGSVITLAGQSGTIVEWESSTDGINWSSINNTTATLTIPSLTQTTQYRAKLHTTPTCTDVFSTVATIVVDQPPTTAVAGPPDEICNTTIFTLQGNTPSVGSGKWTQVSGPVSASFISDTNPNTTVTGLIPGTYQFQWTITASATCPASSSMVTIKVDIPPVGGIATATPAEVCLGSNSVITLSGQTGTIVQWESSTDGTNWAAINNTTATLNTPALTQTTQYRAKLHTSSVCDDVYSTIANVTVDQPPTTAVAGPPDEICNTTAYTLQGNSPLVGAGKWTEISGPPGATFINDANPNTTVNGLVPGTYQFQWTITASASCPASSSTVTIKVDNPPLGGTATPNPAEVCLGSGTQINLTGQFGTIVEWQSSTDGVAWQTIPNSGNNPILQIASLMQTTLYRAKLHTSTICEDVYSSTATVTVDQPPIAANAGQDAEICNSTSYKLQGNNPSPGTGKWTVITGSNVTFDNDTDPTTIVNGLLPGNSYQFRWSITNSPVCPSTTADVTVKDDLPPVGGITSNPATVCSGDNSGQVILTGQVGNVKEWQSSVDNGATWQTITNAGTTTNLNYAQLTQTTQFRAGVINSGVCEEVFSTPTTITVNPPTPIADAGPNHDICNETVITMQGNNPAPFTGLWTQTAGPAVTIVNPGQYNTQVLGLLKGNTYTFKWTIMGIAPCPNTESTVTINSFADVVPSFTMDKNTNCGTLTVNFTNTSTPSPTGTFVWDFGDGSPTVTAVNPPAHTFVPSASGASTTYTIKMTPISNCGSKDPYTAQVTISPSTPVAALVPNQSSACGTFTLTAKNLSPGDNAQYDFYLTDASGNIVQHLSYPDKRDAVFQPITPASPTNYTVYVVATDQCGNKGTSPSQIISVSPSSLVSQVQIKGDVNSVCLGSPVTFQNISSGGDRFTITVYDSNKNPILTLPAGTGDMNYTPTALGTYYVSITAGNEGCGDAPVSALKQFTVYPTPNPSFTYTTDQNANVTFNNTTPDDGTIPASSVTYKWDFGDGSAIDNSYIPATHHFDVAKSPFTVTLTATTPGTNCFNVTQQTIKITFYGNLFLPNAFMPAGSNPELKKFYAKGFGLKTWRMQIFNNFGQLIWESTKLDNNGSPTEGWDGTYKGQIVEQGVYIWQITATLLNGEEWKGMSYHNSAPSRTGAIHLIR